MKVRFTHTSSLSFGMGIECRFPSGLQDNATLILVELNFNDKYFAKKSREIECKRHFIQKFLSESWPTKSLWSTKNVIVPKYQFDASDASVAFKKNTKCVVSNDIGKKKCQRSLSKPTPEFHLLAFLLLYRKRNDRVPNDSFMSSLCSHIRRQWWKDCTQIFLRRALGTHHVYTFII